MSSFADYIKNIYTFIIIIAGIIAFVALVLGGILYLSSAGKPEKLTKARNQILAAFLGVIILLSSYLILKTISPELVSFQIPELGIIEIEEPLELEPRVYTPKLLAKIKEIANNVKIISEGIENSAQEIKELTNECDCENTQSLCMCTGGDEDAGCQPRQCYAGPGSHPCPGFEEIKNNQKRIIAWKDEILYYRNRALVEEEDLLLEIDQVLEEKITYYQEAIKTETDEKVIEYFKNQIKKLEEEIGPKNNLATKLRDLARLIEQIDPPTSEIGMLPNKCLYDEGEYGINNKCDASCKGDCHDTKEGCQPDKCSGGNPCPTDEIQNQFSDIQGLRPRIIQTCEQILNIIDERITFKTIFI